MEEKQNIFEIGEYRYKKTEYIGKMLIDEIGYESEKKLLEFLNCLINVITIEHVSGENINEKLNKIRSNKTIVYHINEQIVNILGYFILVQFKNSRQTDEEKIGIFVKEFAKKILNSDPKTLLLIVKSCLNTTNNAFVQFLKSHNQLVSRINSGSKENLSIFDFKRLLDWDVCDLRRNKIFPNFVSDNLIANLGILGTDSKFEVFLIRNGYMDKISLFNLFITIYRLKVSNLYDSILGYLELIGEHKIGGFFKKLKNCSIGAFYSKKHKKYKNYLKISDKINLDTNKQKFVAIQTYFSITIGGKIDNISLEDLLDGLMKLFCYFDQSQDFFIQDGLKSEKNISRKREIIEKINNIIVQYGNQNEQIKSYLYDIVEAIKNNEFNFLKDSDLNNEFYLNIKGVFTKIQFLNGEDLIIKIYSKIGNIFICFYEIKYQIDKSGNYYLSELQSSFFKKINILLEMFLNEFNDILDFQNDPIYKDFFSQQFLFEIVNLYSVYKFFKNDEISFLNYILENFVIKQIENEEIEKLRKIYTPIDLNYLRIVKPKSIVESKNDSRLLLSVAKFEIKSIEPFRNRIDETHIPNLISPFGINYIGLLFGYGKIKIEKDKIGELINYDFEDILLKIINDLFANNEINFSNLLVSQNLSNLIDQELQFIRENQEKIEAYIQIIFFINDITKENLNITDMIYIIKTYKNDLICEYLNKIDNRIYYENIIKQSFKNIINTIIKNSKSQNKVEHGMNNNNFFSLLIYLFEIGVDFYDNAGNDEFENLFDQFIEIYNADSIKIFLSYNYSEINKVKSNIFFEKYILKIENQIFGFNDEILEKITQNCKKSRKGIEDQFTKLKKLIQDYEKCESGGNGTKNYIKNNLFYQIKSIIKTIFKNEELLKNYLLFKTFLINTKFLIDFSIGNINHFERYKDSIIGIFNFYELIFQKLYEINYKRYCRKILEFNQYYQIYSNLFKIGLKMGLQVNQNLYNNLLFILTSQSNFIDMTYGDINYEISGIKPMIKIQQIESLEKKSLFIFEKLTKIIFKFKNLKFMGILFLGISNKEEFEKILIENREYFIKYINFIYDQKLLLLFFDSLESNGLLFGSDVLIDILTNNLDYVFNKLSEINITRNFKDENIFYKYSILYRLGFVDYLCKNRFGMDSIKIDEKKNSFVEKINEKYPQILIVFGQLIINYSRRVHDSKLNLILPKSYL